MESPSADAVRAKCEALIFDRRLAVKSALTQSLAVVTGGEDSATYFDALRDKTGPVQSVCGAVWRPRSIAYRCLTCEVNPNSAVCVDCFREGDHDGHDYRIVHTNGGCCDCGNTSAWKTSGFCTKHGMKTAADGSPIYQPLLPPAVSANLDAMLSVVLQRLKEDATGAMRDGPLSEVWSARQMRASGDGPSAAAVDKPNSGRPAAMSEDTEQLIRASQNGDARAVQRAAARGAELDAKDGSAFHTTALHWAAQGGHVASVRKLLEAGASVHSVNAYRQTALQCCVFEGHLKTAELLLEHAADPHQEDLVFGSALQIVRNERPRNHAKMLPLLLAAAAKASGEPSASSSDAPAGGSAAPAASSDSSGGAGSSGGGGDAGGAKGRRKSARGAKAPAAAPSSAASSSSAPVAEAAPAAVAAVAATPSGLGGEAAPIGAAVHLEIARSTLHWLGSLCELGDSLKQRISVALLDAGILPMLLELRLQCDRPSPAVVMAIEPLAEYAARVTRAPGP